MRPILRKTKDIILHPKNFFHSIKKEKGIKHPLLYLIWITLFSLFFLVFAYIKQINNQIEDARPLLDYFGWSISSLSFSMSTYFILFISFFVLLLALSFFRYGITHFFIRLFNKKAVFSNSYRALTYSLTPSYLAAPFFLGVVFLWPLAKLQDHWSVYMAAIICTTVFIFSGIYEVYLRVISLMHVQNLKWWQAFLCIYVFGLFGQLIAIVIIEVIILLIVFAIIFAL